jgi:hypothetical protein
MSDAHDAADEVQDSSGNGHNLFPKGDEPAMAGVLNGKTAFTFAGSDGLTTDDEIGGLRYIFAIAAYTGATFADYAGLVDGSALGDLLVGSSGSSSFFAFPNGATRAKNSVAGNSAPVSGVPAVVEWKAPGGVPTTGLVLGHQRGYVSRHWTGPIWEVITYSVVPNALEILNLHRYAAIKYHLWNDLTLAGPKIYPFPTDWSRSLTAAKQVLISRSISGKIKQRAKTTVAKRTIEATFDERRMLEYDAALAFHTEHYGVKSFIFRDWTRDPAVDLEAYLAGEIQERPDGAERTSYGFSIAEK